MRPAQHAQLILEPFRAGEGLIEPTAALVKVHTPGHYVIRAVVSYAGIVFMVVCSSSFREVLVNAFLGDSDARATSNPANQASPT